MGRIRLLLCCVSLFCIGSISAEPPCCLVTISKSGSHLIIKCLNELFGPEYRVQFFLHQSRLRACRKRPDLIPWAHFHQVALVEDMLTIDTKFIFNIRDLRDVLISGLHGFQKTNFLSPTIPGYLTHYQRWLAMPHDRQIKALLSRYPYWTHYTQQWLTSVSYFFSYFDQPNIYISRFENLVGENGGGSQTAQIQEIFNLAHFLEFELTYEQAQAIAEKLFGGTRTFRKGAIGSWKEELSESNQTLFNQPFSEIMSFLEYD